MGEAWRDCPFQSHPAQRHVSIRIDLRMIHWLQATGYKLQDAACSLQPGAEALAAHTLLYNTLRVRLLDDTKVR